MSGLMVEAEPVDSVMEASTQITIVGGGVVGLILANALSRLDVTVTLIEKTADQACGDGRAMALSYCSIALLNALDLWAPIADFSAAISTVRVSDRGHFGRVCLNAADEGLPFLGAVCKLKTLTAAAGDALQKCQNVRVIAPATVADVIETDSSYALSVVRKGHAPSLIRPDAIIAADGADSFIREKLGIGVTDHVYHQSAVVFDITLRRDHQSQAFEHFTDDGVIALLPVAPNRLSCIWAMATDKAKRFIHKSKSQLITTFEQYFGYRLGKIMDITAAQCFPLKLVYADRLWDKNVLLFGNAAHFLHPVSAQGLNLSLRDIGALYDVISQSPGEGFNLLFQRFSDNRLADHRRTIALTHQLMKLFNSEHTAIKHLRTLGLHFLHRNQRLKTLFSHLMMGKWTAGSTLLKMKGLMENGE
ncbi:MAG: FAD-dependent monooxygenase [Francisellaceae bacterium]